MNKINILTYGTFDLLHIGHINILKRASKLGKLIVGLSTDEFNAMKHKEATLSYNDRKQILEAIKYVHKVIPETCWEQKVIDIKKHNIDALVMGSDWSGEFDELHEYCAILYLPRTPNISTTLIKQRLK